MFDMTFSRKIYNFFLNHWLITTFIIFIPNILIYLSYFYIIPEKEAQVYQYQNIVMHTLPFVFISLLFTLMKTSSDKYNDVVKNNGIYSLNVLLQSINIAKRAKLKRYNSYIEKNKNKQDIDPFVEVIQPIKQIKTILENMQYTFSRLFGLNPNSIGLSVIYKANLMDDWDWVVSLNIEEDLGLQELIKNPSTSANQIIGGHCSTIFYPDKRIGILENKFVPGPLDKLNKNIGSIICRDISIDNKDNMRAVLTITTYGTQLCDKNDIETKYKIESIVLPNFEFRIQLELSLLYIKNFIANQQINPTA